MTLSELRKKLSSEQWDAPKAKNRHEGRDNEDQDWRVHSSTNKARIKRFQSLLEPRLTPGLPGVCKEKAKGGRHSERNRKGRSDGEDVTEGQRSEETALQPT